MGFNFNVLTRSDGSAVFTQGETTVIAAVIGPREAKFQKMLINKAYVEAYFKPAAGMTGIGDRFKESYIKNTCESAVLAALYPRTMISLVVQEVQNCGGLVSCAVNACSLALLSARIEMKFLFAGVTCILNENDEIIVNPSRLDCLRGKAVFSFVFDSKDRRIIASHTSGIFSSEVYFDAVDACMEASTDFFNFLRKYAKRKVPEVK